VTVFALTDVSGWIAGGTLRVESIEPWTIWLDARAGNLHR
jgi:hypothetical protein